MSSELSVGGGGGDVDGYDSDHNISVTSSPVRPDTHSSSIDEDDNNNTKLNAISILPNDDAYSSIIKRKAGGLASERGTTPSTGAFTSLIERPDTAPAPVKPLSSNGANNSSNYTKTSDFLSGFSSHLAHQPSFNHALAAQLFLQSTSAAAAATSLIPPPSQWLYTQLYGNYSDLPWFRNNALIGGSFRSENNLSPESSGSVTVDGGGGGEHQKQASVQPGDEKADDKSSPPVSSSKRSPSPDEDTTQSDTEDTPHAFKKLDTMGAIKRAAAKQVDVWRPY